MYACVWQASDGAEERDGLLELALPSGREVTVQQTQPSVFGVMAALERFRCTGLCP